MNNKTRFIEKNTMIVREFDKYIMEYPEFADKIPDNALVVMQIEGDDEFNRWAREAAHAAVEKNTSIVYVTVTEMKPVRLLIEKLRFQKVL